MEIMGKPAMSGLELLCNINIAGFDTKAVRTLMEMYRERFDFEDFLLDAKRAGWGLHDIYRACETEDSNFNAKLVMRLGQLFDCY